VGGATTAVGNATAPATGGGSGSGSGSGTQQPLIDPNLGALAPQQGAAADPPRSLGGAVSDVTGTLGDTVGGTAGQAVKDTGDSLGSTVDGVTRAVTDTATALLGGGARGQ
jgi:hypothetical protein